MVSVFTGDIGPKREEHQAVNDEEVPQDVFIIIGPAVAEEEVNHENVCAQKQTHKVIMEYLVFIIRLQAKETIKPITQNPSSAKMINKIGKY